MIRRSEVGFILLRHLLMLLLRRSRRQMRPAGEGLLLRSWFGGDSIRTAVEAVWVLLIIVVLLTTVVLT
jgi:hypothetical protein